MESPTTVSLKLVIDKKGKRILYAEAGKDFVDFLFNILSLPVGTVTRLLPRQDMVGCLGDLYESLENLSDAFMEPTTTKDALLKPSLSKLAPSSSLLLPNLGPVDLYGCMHKCKLSVTNNPNDLCPICRSPMNLKLDPSKEERQLDLKPKLAGFVKAIATYMVMDNLMVAPMSTASIISLFNRFNVKDVLAIEEREIQIGTKEGLKLLKMCMQSKTVLTDLFLGEEDGEN